MNTMPFSQRPTESPRASHKDDARLEFHSEHQLPAPRPPRPRIGLWLGAVCVAGVLGTAGVWALRGTLTAVPVTGSLRIDSTPAGAAVDVDGRPRGLTPLTLDLSTGAHAVLVTHGDQKQEFDATVTAGAVNTHHVRWSTVVASPPAPDTRGRLQVTSEPGGGTVTVDGVARGTTPMTIDDLEPGDHQVSVQLLGRTLRRTVAVTAGATTSVVLGSAPAAIGTGWLAPRATTTLQIFEKDRLIGTTENDRIVLPAGSHDLEFVADALGFRARRTVVVTAGQTSTVAMSLPQAAVNLNAVPWADVLVDGRNMGQTPLANLMLTIGSHQVTFRHPELGEKQTTVVVSLTEPARVAVDMRGR